MLPLRLNPVTVSPAGAAVRVLAAAVALLALAASGSPSPAKASDSDSRRAEPPARSDPMATAFPLRFDSEIIRLGIVDDSLELNGTYFLVCQRPVAQPLSLFYPFPQDSLLTGARMIEGRTRIDDGSWHSLHFEAIPGANGVRWWAPPCPGGTIEIQGRYRQGLKEKYARYIVTTTRAWAQPLRHARFEIRLPVGATPIEFSFPFAAERDSSGVVYVWETDSFYPDRDISVRWR